MKTTKKTRFKLYISEDGCEGDLRRAVDSKPSDTDGNLMKVVAAFSARDYNDACTIRNRMMGWEEYVPMDDPAGWILDDKDEC